MKCIQCGSELTTGDGLDMICQNCKNKQKDQPVLYGWICPRCGTVHSPFVIQCGCPPPTRTLTTWPEINTDQLAIYKLD